MDILDKRQLNLKCKVATRPNTFLLQCHPANLELLYNIRIDAFGSFLENSMFVVIPLKNMPLSAGHMVLLEAMYRGKIIIITDIPAVRDYVDNDMVFFYKADDCNDLADKIEYVYLNKNDKSVQNKTSLAQKAYFSDYCFTQLLKRIVELHFA